MLPLHKNAKDAKKTTSSHAGLWYDRFFNCYDQNWEVSGDDEQKKIRGKKAWMNTVVGSVGNQKQINKALESRQALVDALGGATLNMCSEWHFVTGMGNNHPVENGFAWHHTLGIPYLTGAAVKGMVRAWCEVWEEFDDDKIKHWFGGKGDEQAGELIFFDALPSKPVTLKADIMTPHYGDWYAKGDQSPKADGSNVPADWHDPNPIPFLVVDKGQSFSFAIAKRAGSTTDLSAVTQALTQALQWLGAGAKTAAGYGRFAEDLEAKTRREKDMREKQKQEEEARMQAEQEVKRASMTPLQADLDRWQASNPEPNTVDSWLNGMDDRPQDEQLQIAEILKAYYEARGTWQKPSIKQKPKVQKIKAILQGQNK